MYDIEIERWNRFVRISSKSTQIMRISFFCQNFTFVQFDKLYYFSLFFIFLIYI